MSCRVGFRRGFRAVSARGPEHAAAARRFTQEVRSLKKELMISFEDTSAPSSLHDIVNGLTAAKAMASIIAERQRDKSSHLTRFVEGLQDAQKRLIQTVRPEVHRKI
jgi:hypothetical protein